MDIFEAIHTRRSIRRFLEKPVEEEKLQKVMEAARAAPSWANLQCWRFIIVKDVKMKESISELTGMYDGSEFTAEKNNPAKKGIPQAPVLIVACAEPLQSGRLWNQHYYLADIGIAAQNIMLSARALGLGTVFIGVFHEEKLRELLEVPSNFRIIGLFPIGYPLREKKEGPPRKDMNEIVFHEKWG
ncbi:MAG: nitroreductase family protein [Candidatus Hodarchaeales archaeon]|jgi:nitroreductase